ncbi:MAG: SpoIID/LytB domain-containing protein [Defluviitaleaceae bacterium]|nr:SpoIID/LytB domain-containing protein [Defluviitaleaceae bacterium]MCL2274258.1 SpoIID/LytB domain-containing protein [Defluviitaleaceae bacterium]
MSAHDKITVKPIVEVAEYLRNLIPAEMPADYPLHPRFAGVAEEEKIRAGVCSFRDFLHTFFDYISAEGAVFAKPASKPGDMKDYPFLPNFTNLLVEMGYSAVLENDVLHVPILSLCCPSVNESGKKKSAKISSASVKDCMQILAHCGFVFDGEDLGTAPTCATFPLAPNLLAGLKALALADMELRQERRYWGDNHLLTCNYRLLMQKPGGTADIFKDFVHPLPAKIREFLLYLHTRYTEMGLACTKTTLSDVNFSYAWISEKNREKLPRDKYAMRVFAFSYSIRNGYMLYVRAKKTAKYADIIAAFPAFLQEKIEAGYGCYRKLGRTRCEGDCQGIALPVDENLLKNKNAIVQWLDRESTK